MAAPTVPNHHAHHHGFAGPTGFLLALGMTIGRSEDARLAVERTGTGADDDVVDIGCGPGTAARHAAGVARGVVGVDPARVMLRVARSMPGGRGSRFVEGTAEHLPLDDGSASVAWSIASVHHWRDVEAGVAEVVRVLRPGGRFLAMERLAEPGATGLASHGWTTEQADAFVAVTERHGLVDPVVSQHQTRRRRVIAVLARRAD